MQAHCTRLFSDENGASRFEDLTIELQQVFSAPGLETAIFSAPFLVSEGSLWMARRPRGKTKDYTKPLAA